MGRTYSEPESQNIYKKNNFNSIYPEKKRPLA
jgi:hypothetical protein